MAKGDYVKVVYRTGVGTASQEVVVVTDGAERYWAKPGRGDTFLEVTVNGRTGKTIQRHLFSLADVVAISEGRKTKAEMIALGKTRAPRPKKVAEPELDVLVAQSDV